MLRLYELNYLISPELSEKELKDCQERINSLLQKEGGVIIETKLPSKINLAYPIKKRESAFLTSLIFQIETEKMKELEKKLKGERNILRYLILAKKLPKKVSPLPSKKPKRVTKSKVELEEIEKKLEEILKEEL